MAIPNEPLTRTEQYLNRTATGGGTIPDEPLTRAEMYLNKIATGSGDVPEVPLTRMEQYLAEIAENGGGGVDPGDITLQTLNVTENGTTNAPDGVAYNTVVANVPNTYGASDEGKVVDNGSLVSQTDSTTTQNGVVDTTTIKQLTVNVPQGITPTGTKTINISANGTTVEDVAAYANAQIVVAVPTGGSGATIASLLANTLQVLEDDNVTALSNSALSAKTALESFKCYNVASIGSSAFSGCTGLTVLVFPLAVSLSSQAFFNVGNLRTIDLGVTSIPGLAFQNCNSLDTLILRNSSVVSLELSALSLINHFKSGGSGGTIYVPQDLIESYKAAPNWSTLDGYETVTWAAIEDSQYEHSYADGTPIPSN